MPSVGLLLKGIMHWFDRLDRQEWVVVLVVVMCFGFLCLRGLGSRVNY